MGEAKTIKKNIAGNKAKRDNHLIRIADELAKPNPNYGRIRHWEGEIRGWEKIIEHLEARLEKRKRRGR